MNTVLILFLALIIILSIAAMALMLTADYLVQNATSLNTKNNSQSVIDHSKFDSPGSSRYYYEGWFFIINNQKTYTENILFNRGTEFIVTLKGSTLNLYVNGGDANKIDNDKGIYDSTGATPLISIPQFPFQKWAQLVINVDALSVDLYIDGKFVQNKINDKTIGATTETPITYGNKFTIGKFAQFKRPAESINPQGVWNHYIRGSGQDQSLTNYHLNAVVTKNSRQLMDKRLV